MTTVHGFFLGSLEQNEVEGVLLEGGVLFFERLNPVQGDPRKTHEVDGWFSVKSWIALLQGRKHETS